VLLSLLSGAVAAPMGRIPTTEVIRASALALEQEARGRGDAWEEAYESPPNKVKKGFCEEDADCAWHAHCGSETKQCRAHALGEMIGPDILMSSLAFVIAGFSLAAGVGGGGLYVPLLMFVLSLETRVATALSQAMLFGGAFAALVYNARMSHPARPERPLINFELALLMAPALMGGAQVGAVVHALAPPVMTLVLLLIVLGDAARKGVRSALNISAQEEKEREMKGGPPEVASHTVSAVARATAEEDQKSAIVLERSTGSRNRLVLIWMLCIALVATKGLMFPMCSPIWWILTIGSAALLSGLSWMFATALSVQEPVDEDDIDFREHAYSLAKMSMFAGCIAAMCGIGGGMIMGPILVELRPKVPPAVSAATTATTLVVLSTSTLLIYICRGMAPPDYSICLSIFTFFGAGVGKILCGWWIAKTGKQSVIVWVLATVTVCSMMLMGLQGIMTFTRDPAGAIAVRNFCAGHIHHTLPATD